MMAGVKVQWLIDHGEDYGEGKGRVGVLCGTEERGKEGVSSMRCVHYLYTS